MGQENYIFGLNTESSTAYQNLPRGILNMLSGELARRGAVYQEYEDPSLFIERVKSNNPRNVSGLALWTGSLYQNLIENDQRQALSDCIRWKLQNNVMVMVIDERPDAQYFPWIINDVLGGERLSSALSLQYINLRSLSQDGRELMNIQEIIKKWCSRALSTKENAT